jgi:hypothetical protein
MQKKLFTVILCVIIGSCIYAQGFGFDDDGGETASAAAPVSVKVGGEIAAELIGFVHDFSSKEKLKETNFGDMVSGALNFSASGANVDAFIGLNLSLASFKELASGLENSSVTPLILDEAYLRAFFGPVNVTAGYRKLTWGKADSLGPLDVINPVDYTDLTSITDIQAMKIARPLVHVSWNTGGFSKLEGVFIPNFAGHRFAREGRWTPAQYSTMAGFAGQEALYQVKHRLPSQIPSQIGPIPIEPMVDNMFSKHANDFSDFSLESPNTSGLEYFQAGLRFSTTIGSADIGAQYFYGNLFMPGYTINGIDAFADDTVSKNQPLLDSLSGLSLLELLELMSNPPDIEIGDRRLISPQIKYNRYHQLGVDYAQVLFTINVRAEFAVHLTEDLNGDDGSVRNPFIGWSLGFDRDLFWGINANVQCNETIRLMNDKVGNNPVYDCEAGTDITNTRITAQLSKKFLRDELETKTTVIWDIENADCYIIPAIIWTIKDVTAELSAGVFAGKESGELGQYWRNSFIKLGLKYSF